MIVPPVSLTGADGKIEYGDLKSWKGIFGIDLREKEYFQIELDPYD